MKKNLIPIVIFLAISLLLIGFAEVTANNKISDSVINNTVLNNTSSNASNFVNSTKAVPKIIIVSSTSKILIDSGANSFYWGERGGIFAYTWKTYKLSNGSILVDMHYKTTTNSWYSSYLVTKSTKTQLKITETSPEVKLYTGQPSTVSYANSSLTPSNFYWKDMRSQIKDNGYFFVDQSVI